MNETDDAELLAEFSHGDCDQAFTVLVNRHIHLVHSVALRQTSNPDQAQEITQAVFIILARKARSLGRNTVLSGWLYHTTRLTAANFQRAEQRRFRREQEAYMRSTLEESRAADAWSELAPVLDGAMARLGGAERDAVVLRYFENKSLQEVGEALGVEERAAQKRVSRALEKLRRVFVKAGVRTTTAAIAAAISAHSVHAAPAALAKTISATALQGSAVAGSTLTLAKETLHMMKWIKTKAALATAGGVLAALGVTAVVLHHRDLHRWAYQAWNQDAKHQAEQAGGPANVTTDPNAQKKVDEQKALAERPK